MKALHGIVFILVIVGGLNWGLIAIGYWMGSNWNVVNLLLGAWPVIENVVYLLVGLSALSLVFNHKNCCI
ncbi:hypothetical protein A2609_00955 [Candidatus Kaiserbacteria bacterium RIFOXYD1_FULL_47_14]|uniref:DUF378 domain-containing protein n=1 Tax=Candidatus Kaiserbacteria bacterium RIFOXYD1_FULL_47_14 TaxID=1798533 RepID=A0A1F6G6Q6_9BACT|nr:MAG: hypothetical protein A2609_00955 [Candidatus Kaiserbacteria bacterium RIFOXYD1_FULL_47_14]